VDALMQRAGQGAADYVWRIAGPQRRVTVLTGPGNNGGDGWVIAETLRRLGARGGGARRRSAHRGRPQRPRRLSG
jgi:NAD(P)H-hydrate repair Nnr-like enzyme with NAD(P)H-hydrate epimerase domain